MVALAAALAALGCGDGDDLDSDTEARWAYLGFDRAVDRALGLGFAGFNAATSANIPVQEAAGDVSGTITVAGQVDQGASANKEMRLVLTLDGYADGAVDDPVTAGVVEEIAITYDTDSAALPSLDMSLRDIPDGTFTGTLAGEMLLSGDVDARAVFALSLSGGLMADGDDVVREPGTLTIVGTVTSGDGTYEVHVEK
ncbi:MAG: hypothetical protein D6689_10125 [Deltaproteobacteria bacterium]|nr:MAG: hypothetical protein D6689_10125 [Deltaproteobacteria bacterium]